MDVGKQQRNLKKIKKSLVFFCFMLAVIGCRQEGRVGDVTVEYEGDKAIALSFTTSDIAGVALFLEGETLTPVLGDFSSNGSNHRFEPVVPFSSGRTYGIWKDSVVLERFTVRRSKRTGKPELTTIFPSQDTVPENLLKIYLLFSEPMQETGHVLDFISVYNETEGKEERIFLELESELWDREHRRLTLWLDPGRIKTDLVPNRERGLPLVAGNTYTLRISDAWRSAQNQKLAETYERRWVVRARDDQRPKVSDWTMDVPKSRTKVPLQVDFGEPLDAILALESLHIADADGVGVEGTFVLTDGERGVEYFPKEAWKKGVYTMGVDAKLEDRAGNNLDRLFDSPVVGAGRKKSTENEHNRVFTVQ